MTAPMTVGTAMVMITVLSLSESESAVWHVEKCYQHTSNITGLIPRHSLVIHTH